jgi:hypothetical protein
MRYLNEGANCTKPLSLPLQLGFLAKAIVVKLSTAVIYEFSQYARAFVSGKVFQHSLMFAGKDGAYASEAPFKGSTLV